MPHPLRVAGKSSVVSASDSQICNARVAESNPECFCKKTRTAASKRLWNFQTMATQDCEELNTRLFRAGIRLSKSSFLLEILSDVQSSSWKKEKKNRWFHENHPWLAISSGEKGKEKTMVMFSLKNSSLFYVLFLFSKN